MLTIREINKVRQMYYDHNYSVAYIARVLKTSRNSIYKYVREYSFNISITKKPNKNNSLTPYRDILISWIFLGYFLNCLVIFKSSR